MIKKLKYLLLIGLYFLAMNAFGQALTDANQLALPATNFSAFMRNLQPTAPKISSVNGSLIIGDDTPDETLTITEDYTLKGDLIIVNQGMLQIVDADFMIDGDIYIHGNGRLTVTGSSFTVVQDYIYEHSLLVVENGSMSFSNVVFKSNGQSWSISLAGQASYKMEDSEVTDGFITAGLTDNSRARITNSQMPGEFLCFGDNDVSFENCDFMLFWFVMPETSVVDVQLPDNLSTTQWSFSDSTQNVRGIPYRVAIRNCTNVMWGLISITGSNATFRDSDFRAVGLLFASDDSLAVSGIANESFHEDDVINLPDRTLRLIESNVQTWNFYVSSQSDITIKNCVFGEILTQGNGKATILNSICDGSGGYVGAFDQSFMLMHGSFIKSQVIARNSSVLIGLNSSFGGMEINADENAVMLIANTQRIAEPNAYAAAVLFEIQMPPVFASINSKVPIYGTMRVIAGPENPIQLTGYRVEFSAEPGRQIWKPTDGKHTNSVVDSVLAVWDTHGLDPGDYGLRITFWHSYGDSTFIDSYARLNETTIVQPDAALSPFTFELEQNYPNPFNLGTEIKFQIPSFDWITIEVHNQLGKKVRTLVNQPMPAGNHKIIFDGRELASGIYFYTIKSKKYIQTKKCLLIK